MFLLLHLLGSSFSNHVKSPVNNSICKHVLHIRTTCIMQLSFQDIKLNKIKDREYFCINIFNNKLIHCTQRNMIGTVKLTSLPPHNYFTFSSFISIFSLQSFMAFVMYICITLHIALPDLSIQQAVLLQSLAYIHYQLINTIILMSP